MQLMSVCQGANSQGKSAGQCQDFPLCLQLPNTCPTAAFEESALASEHKDTEGVQSANLATHLRGEEKLKNKLNSVYGMIEISVLTKLQQSGNSPVERQSNFSR